MAGFLGARVQLVLNQPANTVVQGTVHDIVAGQTLSLIDAYFPATATHLQAFTVQSATIADVRILASQQNAAPQPKQPVAAQVPHRVDTTLSTVQYEQESRNSSAPIDPAILSYDRTRPHKAAQAVAIPVVALPTQPTSQQLPTAQHDNVKRKQRQPKQKLPESVPAPQEPPPIVDTETSRHGNAMNNPGTVKRGKGWRQTPLLQPTQSSSQPKKRKGKQQNAGEDAQNGWATEDATDIQDMGEFDFEANHKLFDKQQVFDDLRKGDTTADEDRLVSHNKLAARKNLLPSENVLSPKLDTDVQGSDADTEVDLQTGRSSSRHSLSRRQQNRTNSSLLEVRPHAAPGPPSSERLLVRAGTASGRPGRPLPISTTTSLKAARNYSPHSATPTAASKRSNGTKHEVDTAAGLYIATDSSPCPTLYSTALALLENEACARYGLLPEAITENAARSIAEQAIALTDAPTEFRRGSRANTFRGGMSSSAHGFENVPPVIVVLAGMHSTGSRALAAARHLSSRGYKVIIAETSLDRQDEQYGKQATVIKRMMRSGATIKRGSWAKANEYIKGLNGPPVVIVDALLSGTKYEEVLEASKDGETTAADVRKMIDWANRSRAPVLSIACPSGLSDHDGSATIVDGEPLAIKADKLIALGAPVTGVLEALKLGERFDISLADIGINIALKADDAVTFGAQWVVPLTFVAPAQADDV